MVCNLSKKDPTTRRALKSLGSMSDKQFVLESPCCKILDLTTCISVTKLSLTASIKCKILINTDTVKGILLKAFPSLDIFQKTFRSLVSLEQICRLFLVIVTFMYPAANYMFNVNNRNTRTRCEIYSKLTIKAPLASFWYLYC